MKKQLLILAVPVLILASVAFAKQGNIIVEKISLDPRLIGTWASDCLTPDPKSPWSEKHTFVFTRNNTARHERISFDAAGCAGSVNMNLVNSYRYETPSVGVVDLKGDGGSIYDIYVVNANILMMGHGFRNNMSYAGAHGRGASPGTRISSLNQYIVYKKLGK